MPRYFFDVYDGREAFRDEVGAEAEGVWQAADEAASLLPEFARDALAGERSKDFAALVRDEAGHIVYRAALLFRGECPHSASAPFEVSTPPVSSEMARARRLRADARELQKRLSDNVRDLTAMIEEALLATASSRVARGGPGDRAP